MLQSRGSLYVTRPTTAHYYGDAESLRRTMARVFGAVTAGHIRPAINQRFPLERAADAQRALEARQTTGATLLVP
jgi:NADPH2:quinone reductase